MVDVDELEAGSLGTNCTFDLMKRTTMDTWIRDVWDLERSIMPHLALSGTSLNILDRRDINKHCCT